MPKVDKCFRLFNWNLERKRYLFSILSTFHLSALLTFLSCSKPSATEPEPQRPQIEVTGDITEEPACESGKNGVK